MRLTRSNKATKAFTLLEIMVAISLLSLIVIAIYSSWNTILKSSRVALDAAAASQRERITMRTLQDSLLCACMFNANATNYLFEASSDSDFSYLTFVARLPKSFPRGGKFGDLNIRRLEFAVEKGNDNKPNLVLRQRPLVADFTKDEAEHPLILAHDVVKFLVEFIDPKSGDWIPEWTYTNQLPREARITVGLGHLDQYSQKAQEARVAVVALPSVSVSAGLQAIGGPGPGGAPGQNNPANNNNPPVANTSFAPNNGAPVH